MISATATKGKATKSRVIFDSTRHRNRHTPSFAAGLAGPTRWTGDHRYTPFTAEDLAWAEEVFLADSTAEIDAEEDAYHQMLDQMALESAAIDRYTRGHVM